MGAESELEKCENRRDIIGTHVMKEGGKRAEGFPHTIHVAEGAGDGDPVELARKFGRAG